MPGQTKTNPSNPTERAALPRTSEPEASGVIEQQTCPEQAFEALDRGPVRPDMTDRFDPTRQIMARLRLETTAAHVRIENNPRLAALLRPGLTEQQYQDVLLRYHAYFARVEPGLFARLIEVVPAADLNKRRKIPLLRDDLAAYGLAARAIEPGPSREAPTYPQALGRLYVHEGASLGGRMIHAALRRGAGQMRPCAFFAGYGAATAEMWRRTQNILGAGLAGESAIAEAADAANATFQEIDSIMS